MSLTTLLLVTFLGKSLNLKVYLMIELYLHNIILNLNTYLMIENIFSSVKVLVLRERL